MKNILFISADQLRFDAMGFMNTFPVRTPHIDALAASGTVFDNAYCTNALCVPSRASIMTGRYSFQHGVYYNDQGWSNDLDTVPGNLSDNGFYTAEFGKTHFMPQRKNYGFDKVVNELSYKDHCARLGLVEKSPMPLTSWEEQVAWVYRDKPGKIPYEHYEPVYHTSNAIDELNRLSQQRQCTGPACHEPFFMWLSFLRPHVPCTPPEPYFSMYPPESIPDPIRRKGEEKKFPAPMKRFHGLWSHLPDDTMRKIRSQYLADVTIVDEQVGRITAALKQLGMSENTLIVFFSDHGDHLGDHHLQQKGFFFESSTRVPLIVAGPGIPQGKRCDANVTLADLMPTAMDYSGLYQEDLYDEQGQQLYHHQPPAWSRSLLNTLKYEDSPLVKDRCVIVESAIHGQFIMVKQGQQKYCWYPQTNELQHFDLTKDPDEFDPQEIKMDALPQAVRETIEMVEKHTKEIAKGKYFFNGKIRPMFT